MTINTYVWLGGFCVREYLECYVVFSLSDIAAEIWRKLSKLLNLNSILSPYGSAIRVPHGVL